jgi:hypothetical protein
VRACQAAASPDASLTSMKAGSPGRHVSAPVPAQADDLPEGNRSAGQLAAFAVPARRGSGGHSGSCWVERHLLVSVRGSMRGGVRRNVLHGVPEGVGGNLVAHGWHAGAERRSTGK